MSRSNVLTRQVLQLREMFEALDKSEQDLFLDLVDPQPEVQAKAKRKRAASAPKSPKKGLPSIAGTAGRQSSPAPATGSPAASTAAETASAGVAGSGGD